MTKIILITGSTDGIGKLAAIKLAKDGHHLYLHGRNAGKLSNVIEEIKARSNNKNIKGFVADFSELSVVRKMAEQVKEELSTIDVLINNAGIFKTSEPLNQNGLDVRIVVNYLAPYVLTKALLPLVKNSLAPRIINLSSAAQSTVSTDVLNGNVQTTDQTAYAQSKLAILMWSFDLSRQEPDISVTALNPGSLLNTNMVREAYGSFWAPADKGANIIYDIAVSEEYEGVTGKYFDNDKGSFNKAHKDAYDDYAVEQLMVATEKLILNNSQ